MELELKILNERNDVIGLPITSTNDLKTIYADMKSANPNLKDYESWLRDIPHKDIERELRQQIKNYPLIKIAKNLRDKAKAINKGWLPFDVISRTPAGGNSDRVLNIGDHQAILVLTGTPKGVHARDGFSDVDHRIVWGQAIANYDIRRVFSRSTASDTLVTKYAEGKYQEGISSFLQELNNCLQRNPLVLY